MKKIKWVKNENLQKYLGTEIFLYFIYFSVFKLKVFSYKFYQSI
jgi:hypothetical protein